ncbi:MAG: acyl-CoA dehydrogenase C-terminal domain-containing protein, partial [Sandaracinobacteroides sp.]
TAAHAEALADAKTKLEAATFWLMQNGMANPDNAGAASTPYLRLMALVVFGYFWLVMEKASLEALADGAADFGRQFYQAKLVTARHFFERQLPDAHGLAAKAQAGSENLMAMPAEAF